MAFAWPGTWLAFLSDVLHPAPSRTCGAVQNNLGRPFEWAMVKRHPWSEEVLIKLEDEEGKPAPVDKDGNPWPLDDKGKPILKPEQQ